MCAMFCMLQHRIELAVWPSRTAAQHVYHVLHASQLQKSCCLTLHCCTACLPCFPCFIAAVNLLIGPPLRQHRMSTMFCVLHSYSVCFAVRPSRTAAQYVYHVLQASALRQACRLALHNCSTTCPPCFASFTTAFNLLSGPPLLQHSMSAASALLQHLPWTAARHLGSFVLVMCISSALNNAVSIMAAKHLQYGITATEGAVG